MSPIAHSDHAAARADITHSSPFFGSPVTASMGESTDSPSLSTSIQMDTSVPPPPATEWPPLVEQSFPVSSNKGMSNVTKIGLGMIPVVVFLCAMWIFFLFWWRKRRLRGVIRHMGPPPVPEKDLSLISTSNDSSRRGSKVLNMAAFSTPVHDGRYREAQVFGQSQMPNQSPITDAKKRTDAIVTERAETDSPIDATSPFRLKRGDTLKRCSLGTEISSLWPSPPPSAWIKQPVKIERVISPPLPASSSLAKVPPKRNR